MKGVPVSVTVITKNEEKNIGRALKSVAWADDVVVVDCGSQDRTCEIAESLGARVFKNEWRGYGQQKNYAQSMAKNLWVLNLDADEEVSPELKLEIISIIEDANRGTVQETGFYIPRKTVFAGRWIKHGGWYPGYIKRLALKSKATWTEPSVHEDLVIKGRVGKLINPLWHFSFPSLESQVLTNLRYAKLGSQNLTSRVSLLHLVFKPIGKWFETFVIKQGWRDGIRGFLISVNAAYSIFLKYAFRFEVTDLNPKQDSHEDPYH